MSNPTTPLAPTPAPRAARPVTRATLVADARAVLADSGRTPRVYVNGVLVAASEGDALDALTFTPSNGKIQVRLSSLAAVAAASWNEGGDYWTVAL